MSLLHTLQVAARVLAAEGWRAVRDRTLDRRAEARRRASFRPATTHAELTGGHRFPTLIVAANPPAPRLGGVSAQLFTRLEAASAPTALLYPEPGGYRLEVQAGGSRRSLFWPAPPPPWPEPAADLAFEDTVALAATAIGASTLHVEGLAGLPAGSLLTLARKGFRLVLSLHDFAAFCPRPHLFEEPRGGFCEASRDRERCAHCLAETWSLPRGFQEGRRKITGELLQAAERRIYPSEYLRRAHQELFPGLDPTREAVVAPAVSLPPPAPPRPGPVRHIAFVGSVQPHKGALVFEELVATLAPRFPQIRWSAYGGGDAPILRRLRGFGVRVRGYYRHGCLSRLLQEDRVDLALLLSIVPESYGLTLDECRAAGVPAFAFDQGALAERMAKERLVPLQEGVEGMAKRLEAILET